MTKQELQEMINESVSRIMYESNAVEVSDEDMLAFEEAYCEACFDCVNLYNTVMNEGVDPNDPAYILDQIKNNEKFKQSMKDKAMKVYQKTLNKNGGDMEAAAAAKKAAESSYNSLAAKLGRGFAAKGDKIVAMMKTDDGKVDKKKAAIAIAATAIVTAATSAGIIAAKKASKAKKSEEENKEENGSEDKKED